MPTVRANRKGNSGAEERFIELFCDVFGPERGQYVYMQYPFVDIYGGHRTIDYAINSHEGRIAIEVDGNQWHQPGIVSEDKYHDDLLKQNSLVYEGWKVYRWTSRQIEKTPERIKDELVTFLGTSPMFRYIEKDVMQVPKKRWLIPAALAACLFLIDFRALFPPHTFRELSNGLLKTGEHLMTPFSMVLVALAIAAVVPRRELRLPVVLNLAASLLLWFALKWLDGPGALQPLRLAGRLDSVIAPVCFYGFLMWMVRRFCLSAQLRTGLTVLLAAVVLFSASGLYRSGPHAVSQALAGLVVIAAYLWLLTGFVRRRAAHAGA